jgi:hypothetical protein
MNAAQAGNGANTALAAITPNRYSKHVTRGSPQGVPFYEIEISLRDDPGFLGKVSSSTPSAYLAWTLL